jgi:hypothetical protein
MKVIAFYLPQYHPIPENDEWWGKGFTEWTNVKKAQPLFKGHRQPRIPLNNNYYHLLDPDVQQWQASTAKDHGIDGFCYYHYWFNGHKLLEKPFEQVLNSGKPDFPFCFAWANEPWTRAWDGGDKEVLMPQDYGGVEDWEAHFQFLLAAFKDSRYIRFCDKPVFLIYRSASIPECDEMIRYWRLRAEEEGLPGLHLVSMLTVYPRDTRPLDFDSFVEFEPMNTFRHHLPSHFRLLRSLRTRIIKVIKLLYPKASIVEDIVDYRMIWNFIVQRSPLPGVYPGAFVDWDNSARKHLRATVMKNSDVNLFAKYFGLQFQKAQKFKSPFLFINAWNEWAEGTYLEPDTVNHAKHLEAIRDISAKK